jgi:hypothetical protein
MIVAASLVLSLLGACAAKEVGDPVPVNLGIGFPSTPAAVVTDSVRLYVFAGQLDCAELVTIKKTGRPLPPTVVERRATPCELQNGADVEFDRGKSYTVLVSAQVAEKDFLVGCSVQGSFGDVRPAPIDLDYADNTFTLSTIEKQTPGATTRCAKFTDKCNNTCR